MKLMGQGTSLEKNLKYFELNVNKNETDKFVVSSKSSA